MTALKNEIDFGDGTRLKIKRRHSRKLNTCKNAIKVTELLNKIN